MSQNFFPLDIDQELLAARDHINVVLRNSGIGENVVLSVPDAKRLEKARDDLYSVWIKYKKRKG